MNAQFTAIIQRLVAEQGKEALINPAKCRPFLPDYTGNEFTKERRLLIKVVEAGVAKEIDAAENIETGKKLQMRYLQEDLFIAGDIAMDVVDMLAFVLRGNRPVKPAANTTTSIEEYRKRIAECTAGKPDHDKVIRIANEAIGLYPNDAFVYRTRGEAFRRKGQYDNAIADCTEAIRLDPNYALAYWTRGEAFRLKGQYDNAIANCTETIRFDPNNALAYWTRGEAFRMTGQYDNAVSDCTEAIRLDPNYTWAYWTRGEAFNLKGQYDNAVSDYNEAIRLDPNNALAYEKRGEVFNLKGQYDNAIADCTEAIRLAPHFADAYTYRGIAYLEKRKIAIQNLNGLDALKRENWEYDMAISDFTEAIRLNPNDAMAYFRRGFVYTKKDLETNEEKAIADLTEAIRIDPNFVQAYDLRAYI
jgi:tetratricopeptide (TPR) repeat protein